MPVGVDKLPSGDCVELGSRLLPSFADCAVISPPFLRTALEEWLWSRVRASARCCAIYDQDYVKMHNPESIEIGKYLGFVSPPRLETQSLTATSVVFLAKNGQ